MISLFIVKTAEGPTINPPVMPEPPLIPRTTTAEVLGRVTVPLIINPCISGLLGNDTNVLLPVIFSVSTYSVITPPLATVKLPEQVSTYDIDPVNVPLVILKLPPT
jgi:hypothetical protein